MSKIPVVILPDGGDRAALALSFPRDVFEIMPLDFTSVEYNTLTGERFMVKQGLSKCAELYPDTQCILIKDTSVSACDADRIISIAEESVDNSDIFYLCRWRDSCNLYRDEILIDGVPTVRTFRPQGFQAIVFDVNIRNAIISDSFQYNQSLGKILTSKVYNNTYTARTAVVNIFNFNILRFAADSDDFKKANACTDIIVNGKDGVTPSRYLLVAGVTILIVMAGAGMFLIGPDHKTAKEKAKQNIKVNKPIDK